MAGRIMGVIMRLEELEDALKESVAEAAWIADYGEWATFGVVEEEVGEEEDTELRDLVTHVLQSTGILGKIKVGRGDDTLNLFTWLIVGPPQCYIFRAIS